MTVYPHRNKALPNPGAGFSAFIDTHLSGGFRMGPFDVFISFTHNDLAVTEAISRELHNRGITCWYYTREMQGGAHWQAAIMEALKLPPKAMVLVLSDEAARSTYVKKEITVAANDRIPIIPFRLPGKDLPDDILFMMSDVHMMSAGSQWKKSIPALCDSVETRIGKRRAGGGPEKYPDAGAGTRAGAGTGKGNGPAAGTGSGIGNRPGSGSASVKGSPSGTVKGSRSGATAKTGRTGGKTPGRNARKKRTLTAALAIALAAAGLAVLLGNRQQDTAGTIRMPDSSGKAYYGDYRLNNGLPEGTGELTKEEAAGQQHCEIEVRNGTTTLTVRDAGGRMTEKRSYNAAGNLILADGVVAIQQWRYDSNGKKTEYRGLDKEENIRLQIRYNSGGKAEEERHYKADGSLKPDDEGRAVFRWLYDRNGKLSECKCYDEGEELVYYETYNVRGDALETRYYVHGEYVTDPKRGYAKVEQEYDEAGNRIRVRYLDENDRPVYAASVGCASYEQTFDGENRFLSLSYFDEEGHLFLNPLEDYARCVFTYSEEGWKIICAYLDEEGKPHWSRTHGCAASRTEYDEEGRLTGWSYHDTEGNLVDNPVEGYARYARDLDEDGTFLDEHFYDAGGNEIARD